MMKQFLTAILLSAMSQVTWAEWDIMERPDRVQIFLGVMDIDDETGELQNEEGEPVEVDFDNLPTFGIEVETPYGKNRDEGLEYGINAGGGLSWSGDGTSFRGTVGGREGANVVFRLDNSFFVAEMHLGGFLRAHMGKFADFYIGGGPALIFGSHDVEDVETEDEEDPGSDPIILEDGTVILQDDSSSDIVFGYYARAGIEFDVGSNSQMGLGVRYLGAEMDFDDTIGEVDLGGLQVLFTYSSWF